MSLSLTEQARQKLAELMSELVGEPVLPAELEPVCSGASGRIIMRARGLIAVYWTDERADNNSFLPAAKGLGEAGLNVPEIYAEWQEGQGNGACVMSDLGTQDLLSAKGCSWLELSFLYKMAFEALMPLYKLKPTWDLQPPFNAKYYAWEQDYFAEHFLGTHLGLGPEAIASLKPAFDAMAKYLAALPRVPVHRDCQSQNIMFCEDEAWLIDFQGMRRGRMEYDMCSLIFDPYMDLHESQRAQLLMLWMQMWGRPLKLEVIAACGMQRLMQALGAFANIGHNQQREWYLEQIPAGLRALKQLAELAPEGSHAHKLYSCLNDVKSL